MFCLLRPVTVSFADSSILSLYIFIFRDIKYIKSQDTATTIPAIDESQLFSLDQSRVGYACILQYLKLL